MIHDFSKVFDTDNPEWLKVLEIFERNEQYPKKRVRGRAFHHKFPRSCSKLLNEAEDNDADNMISLSFAEHFMVHYYYYRLAKEGFKSRMALAFKLMADNFEGSITDITPELAESISIEHQNATELANQFSSENGKGKAHRGTKWTDEQRARLSAQRMGHPNYLTEEGKRRIAESNRLKKTGTKASEETRRKMSESQKGKHSGPKRPLTDAEKQHLSDIMKGRKVSDAAKEKIGASKRGKHYILINGKKKLVGPDYVINNVVEENNE